MREEEREALADLRTEAEEPVLYTGLGLVEHPIAAIRSEQAAGGFPGSGSTARQVGFEIGFGSVPGRPEKGDTIVHDGTLWSVIDVTRRDDLGAWQTVVSDENGDGEE